MSARKPHGFGVPARVGKFRVRLLAHAKAHVEVEVEATSMATARLAAEMQDLGTMAWHYAPESANRAKATHVKRLFST